MKTTKKLIAFFLAAIMIFSALPVINVLAETGVELTYIVEDDEVTITECDEFGNSKLTIPSKIDGYPVTKIGDSAFSCCDSLTDITIPDSVTSIGDSAFEDCSSLTSITIPDSVTSIGDSAFEDCSSLTSITIPDSVTSIGDSAFSCCDSLTDITIPDSVTSIGDSAFYECSSLTSITIPDSVTRIGSYAFSDCSSLSNVKLGSGITKISDDMFYNCDSLTNITIPDNVKSIELWAFEDCSSLTSITIPAGVTSIDSWAFEDCSNLTSINVSSNNKVYSSKNGILFNKNKTTIIKYPEGKTEATYKIPNSVTCIDGYAFENCSSLKNITIPNSVTEIGFGAFSGTAYYNDSSNWKDDVLYIGKYLIAAKETMPGTYTIKSGTKCIAAWVFSKCSRLTSITIPNSVTNIGYGAFKDTAYYSNSSNWKNGVLYIGNYLIEAKESVKGSYKIKSGTKCIANLAFSDCTDLTNVTIPDSMTIIGSYAFVKCSDLTSVTIPSGVTSIGKYAFGYNWTAENGYKKISNFTIHGYKGSTAETYAKENKFTFVSLGNMPHDHSYTSKVTTKATCTKAGTRTYTCECGDSYTKKIAALGHSYSSKWTVDKKATCTKAGSKSHHCTRCSAKSDVTTIKATGHSYKTTTTTKATTSKSGTRTTKCTVCGKVKSKSTIAKISSIKLSKTSYTYNGETKKPTVTVKDSKGNKLKSGTDYTVKYSSGRKNVGKYTVTVTFKGKYSGTKKLTFKIKPRSTSISKLTAGKKKFTVTWKKRTTQTSGYQLEYSTSSSMNNASRKTYTTTSKNTRTVSNLKSAKKYYVRVRTYKNVKISGKTYKYYSSWSSIKSVKTK